MSYLNKSLDSWAVSLSRACNFSLILAFDYYDGPEIGLALLDSGRGVRFSSLGDSRSRHFRAFELLPICGNWTEQVKAIQNSEEVKSSCRVLFPQNGGGDLLLLQRAVFSAEVNGQYIGIGSPNFEWLYVINVAIEDIVAIRELTSPQSKFDQAHRLLKSVRQKHGFKK